MKKSLLLLPLLALAVSNGYATSKSAASMQSYFGSFSFSPQGDTATPTAGSTSKDERSSSFLDFGNITEIRDSQEASTDDSFSKTTHPSTDSSSTQPPEHTLETPMGEQFLVSKADYNSIRAIKARMNSLSQYLKDAGLTAEQIKMMTPGAYVILSKTLWNALIAEGLTVHAKEVPTDGLITNLKMTIQHAKSAELIEAEKLLNDAIQIERANQALAATLYKDGDKLASEIVDSADLQRAIEDNNDLAPTWQALADNLENDNHKEQAKAFADAFWTEMATITKSTDGKYSATLDEYIKAAITLSKIKDQHTAYEAYAFSAQENIAARQKNKDDYSKAPTTPAPTKIALEPEVPA